MFFYNSKRLHGDDALIKLQCELWCFCYVSNPTISALVIIWYVVCATSTFYMHFAKADARCAVIESSLLSRYMYLAVMWVPISYNDFSFRNPNNVLCRWEDDIVGLVEKEHGNQKVLLSFECETLKADKDAEDHIIKYMPNLRGLDAVGKHSD